MKIGKKKKESSQQTRLFLVEDNPEKFAAKLGAVHRTERRLGNGSHGTGLLQRVPHCNDRRAANLAGTVLHPQLRHVHRMARLDQLHQRPCHRVRLGQCLHVHHKQQHVLKLQSLELHCSAVRSVRRSFFQKCKRERLWVGFLLFPPFFFLLFA